MSEPEWEEALRAQREHLGRETQVLLDLLEEIDEVAHDPGDGRASAEERDQIERQLRALDRERQRLVLEQRELGTFGGVRPDVLEIRRVAADTQRNRLDQLLDEWRKKNRAGRRRRVRDRLWLDALLLEAARLTAEARRLREQGARPAGPEGTA